MHSEALAFEPFRRDDFPLLSVWLAEPLVARWWNHDPSPEGIEAWFGPSIDGEDCTEVLVVRAEGRPVGLLQRYRIDAYPEYVEELAAVCELPESALGIDYLLGEPDVRGQGLGTAMIAAFVAQSWSAYPDSGDVIVAVAAGNPASWRSLQSAGFTRVAEGELKPDNPLDPPEHYIYRFARPIGPDADSD